MSYILDALKKSEQQRPPGPVPDLFAVHGPQQGPPPRSAWPAVAVAALLCVAAGFGVWIGVRSGGGAPPAPPSPAPAAPVTGAVPTIRATAPAPAAPQASSPAAAPAPVSSAPARTSASAAVPASRATVARRPVHAPVPAAAEVEVARPAPAETSAAPAIPEPAAPAVPAAPPPDGRVLDLSELPSALRAELPPLAMSGHIWSEEPALRMLTLQDRLLKEGADVAPGLRLEEITPAGGVFTYKGYRFRAP
jgi:general secretion pathway protein B